MDLNGLLLVKFCKCVICQCPFVRAVTINFKYFLGCLPLQYEMHPYTFPQNISIHPMTLINHAKRWHRNRPNIDQQALTDLKVQLILHGFKSNKAAGEQHDWTWGSQRLSRIPKKLQKQIQLTIGPIHILRTHWGERGNWI